MEPINDFFELLSSFLWGWPMMILLLGTHVYLTFRLRIPQRKLFTGIRLSVKKDPGSAGDVSQFGRLHECHDGYSKPCCPVTAQWCRCPRNEEVSLEQPIGRRDGRIIKASSAACTVPNISATFFKKNCRKSPRFLRSHPALLPRLSKKCWKAS